MSNIVRFTGITRLPIPVDQILDGAKEAGLTEVLIAGYDADGEYYFAASEPGGPENLWLLAQMQKMLLSIGDDDD